MRVIIKTIQEQFGAPINVSQEQMEANHEELRASVNARK
jgi:hypothetical protein